MANISVAVISKSLRYDYNTVMCPCFLLCTQHNLVVISDDKILFLITVVTNIIFHTHRRINKSAHDLISLLIQSIIIQN